jgi:hypothetical protein
MKPPHIPTPAKRNDYPPPGSIEEVLAMEAFGPDVMAQALFKFSPDNMGPAVASLCIALGTLYRMLPPVAEFYGSPEKFAAACQIMIVECAADDDGPKVDTPSGSDRG